jgi:hypothetical protein
MAEDRSDAMLHAFQEACFPRLDDPAARRLKIVGAGFAQVPVDAVPEIKVMVQLPDQIRKLVGLPDSYQGPLPSVEYETYRGRREGLDLVVVLQALVSHGDRRSQCIVYDFGAVEPVSEKKVAEWIGRPADKQRRLRLRDTGWVWRTNGAAALPGGYYGVMSAYETATRGIPWSAASLRAEAPPSREPAAK